MISPNLLVLFSLIALALTVGLSFARQVLSYLCVHEGLSRAEVGRFLGGRSRAAVSYATKTLERRMAESSEVRARVEEFL